MKVISSRFYLKTLIFTFCIIYATTATGSVKIGSWNLQNFGLRKADWAINLMASSLKDLDIVAVQEVNVSPSGVQAVAKLVAALNKTGNKWDYCISEITTSDNFQERERYAFLWKVSQIKIKGKAFLDTKFANEICREPFIGTFKKEKMEFTLVNIHAIPKKKQPETELKYLKFMPAVYKDLNLIFLGDFNCPDAHSVFNPLKTQGFVTALTGQKTTLKQKCINGDCLASIYDNIFFRKDKFIKIASGAIIFYTGIEWIKTKNVSDHLPIYVILE